MRAKSRSTLVKIYMLILFILNCLGVGWAGSQVSPGNGSSQWYEQLNKPDWNPPGWLFGPVWTTLYIIMAIAAWRIWKKSGFSDGVTELSVFTLQLILNGLWSFLFFGLQNPGLAFIEIIMLLGTIIFTTWLFFQKDRIAGWLMVPYILWVSFAAVLNRTIWLMN